MNYAEWQNEAREMLRKNMESRDEFNRFILDQSPPCDFEYTPMVRNMFERDRLLREQIRREVQSEIGRILGQVIAMLDLSETAQEVLDAIVDEATPGPTEER